VPAYGSECFGHVPNQSALTEVFQDASKIGFNLHPWAVTDTVGVSQFRKADGVGLHQFRANQFRAIITPQRETPTM
jgi:hypothetical protein